MIRRPPRSTLDRSSAASDVYKRQIYVCGDWLSSTSIHLVLNKYFKVKNRITWEREKGRGSKTNWKNSTEDIWSVSYTHLRAHETVLDLVCRLLLEKKNTYVYDISIITRYKTTQYKINIIIL